MATKRKQCITSDEATPHDGELSKPCTDCPWARKALAGWLGPLTADEWINVALSDTNVPCHVFDGPQCAGLAIFRANLCKSPRDRSIIQREPDREIAFATREEFLEHHTKKLGKLDG